MQQEFTPQVEEVKVDPSKIKGQYSQMNANAEQAMNNQPLTEDEMKAKVAAEEERLDIMLPYYRKQKEALELEIAITSLEVQMGKVPAKSVPGTIGKQLEVQELETKLQWAQLMLQQNQTLEGLNKRKEEIKKQEEEIAAANQTPAAE